MSTTVEAPVGATPPLDRTSVGDRLLAIAERCPEAPALLWDLDTEPASMTFAELARRARVLAGRLLEELTPGDRLVLWSGNNPEWVVAEFAAALAGVVLVPMNPALTDDEARYIVASSSARVVLAGPQWRGRDLITSAAALQPDLIVHALAEWAAISDDATVPGTLPAVSPDDDLLIQYTSGTTGTPKGAVLTHLVGTNVGPLSHRALGLTDDDVVCSPLPFHHVGGSLCTLLATILRGGTYVVLPGFDAEQTMRALQRGGVTFFGGVPTMMLALLELGGGTAPDLPSLRMTMIGGSVVSPSLIAMIEAAFAVEVANGYGQSEAPSSLQTVPGDSAVVKAETIGRANPYREVAILDPLRKPLPAGTVGELCIRGELIMRGYWEQLRDGRPTSAYDEHGWLHTGDLAAMDEDGVVTLHGRLRDVIIRGGENIYPAEVESVLATHPDITDVAVVAAPDERWGEVPIAFVRTTSGTINATALEEFARTHLASFKVPRTWHRVSAFPLTASGKIQKFKLSQHLQRP
ncbi:class I adenylate-forming enzyme family protein [Gordonia polyisoprenivorans]|uniref:class I adenylate-forming enzyme family protein n=1 Tax=Gordonia polyisoprenivorans TaxID=84595 RepID=UPI001AD69631|nr:class I adenylate-forming enzyme family protein [Gordonia polyisoprenivorans]QTI70994.1 acyl--CoA ligase [Gordonia polyisoprenivorans]